MGWTSARTKGMTAMMNQILMSSRLTSNYKMATDDSSRYCKFSIAIDRPKHNDRDAVAAGLFGCITFECNVNMVNKLLLHSCLLGKLLYEYTHKPIVYTFNKAIFINRNTILIIL